MKAMIQRFWQNFLVSPKLQNLMVWEVLFFVLLFTTHFTEEVSLIEKIVVNLMLVLFIAAPVYVNNFFVLPRFQKQQFGLGILLYIVNVVAFSFAGPYIMWAFHSFACLFMNCVENFSDPSSIGGLAGGVVLATIMGMAIRIARDSLLQNAKTKEAELSLLKAQLNPHFLFNTLNNLYGLSVTKSDKLPGLMLQLSDLLRYSLYDTKERLVPLEKEINYIQNYVALERLRLEDKTNISLDLEGDFSQHQIAPMMLIVFLENAFKHHYAKQGERGEVIIRLRLEGDTLEFSCDNSSIQHEVVPVEPRQNGIGLYNVRKRLQLLYPERHQLDMNKDSTSFKVQLKLQL